MVTLTIDLDAPKSTLVKAAQLILQFAGYEPPPKAQPAAPEAPLAPGGRALNADALVAEGKAITREQMEGDAPPPEQAFATQVPPPMNVVPPPPPAFAAIVHSDGSHVMLDLPPPPASGIEVDAHGLPWDPRIHAGTRAKIADGTWRQKRGVDLELLAKVEGELRQTMGAPVPPAAPPAPPAPQVPDSFTAHGADARAAALPKTVPQVPPAPFAGNAAPPAPPVSGTPTVPASAGAATGASPGNPQGAGNATFPQLMKAITAGFTSGTITQQAINAAVNKVGLPALPMLAARSDLVPAVATELGIAL